MKNIDIAGGRRGVGSDGICANVASFGSVERKVQMKRIGLIVGGVLCASATFGDLAEYVNPFVGTDGPGHTYPALRND